MTACPLDDIVKPPADLPEDRGDPGGFEDVLSNREGKPQEEGWTFRNFSCVMFSPANGKPIQLKDVQAIQVTPRRNFK